MVLFGLRDDVHREVFLEEDPEETVAALKRTNPDLDLQKIVWHNWTKDEYAQGVWVVFRTAEAEKRLPVLRDSVGRVYFANADWAHGWRGYIDGAVEQGLESSAKVWKLLLADTGTLRASL